MHPDREDPIRRINEAFDLAGIPVVSDELIRALADSGTWIIAMGPGRAQPSGPRRGVQYDRPRQAPRKRF